ncbi:hypothetical protein [Breoghania sp. JC706]|uniref:hypothetical protein n=1 Tax=Breoghania sp. JC706 TaxID=3117732 RepID=UPI00300AD1C5
MSLTGTVVALHAASDSDERFREALRGEVERLHPCSDPADLNDILRDSTIILAVVADCSGMSDEDLVSRIEAAERAIGDRNIPLVCLASRSFADVAAIRADAILTHPVPPAAVIRQIGSLNRAKAREAEVAVRLVALREAGIAVAPPVMQIPGDQAGDETCDQISDRPSILVVGTRGRFSQIESILGAEVHTVAALTADMANLYLGWQAFDAVVLDQAPFEAIDTLQLLRSNPVHHDLPIIVLAEDFDKAMAERAYAAHASDVVSLRASRADLLVRLTCAIRTRRLDHQTQEMLLRSQDALTGADGTIPASTFQRYLEHASVTATRRNATLTVTRLVIEADCGTLSAAQALEVHRPLLRLIRRLVRIEDLTLIVQDSGLVTVFPDSSAEDTERTLGRIRGIIRNTPISLDNGASPLRLDASARVTVFDPAA